MLCRMHTRTLAYTQVYRHVYILGTYTLIGTSFTYIIHYIIRAETQPTLVHSLHGSHNRGNINFQDISRKQLPFSRTNYTRFKGNKSRYVRKTYHIYSIHDRLLTFLWYSLLLTASCCLMNPLLFKFQLTWDIKTMYLVFFFFYSRSFLVQG